MISCTIHIFPKRQSCIFYSNPYYYNIIDNDSQAVELTYPNYSNGDYWHGYQKPIGDIVIPNSVEHD